MSAAVSHHSNGAGHCPAFSMAAAIRWFAFLGLFAANFGALRAQAPAAKADRATLIVVAGAAGEAEFETDFTGQIETWRKVGAQAQASVVVIGAEAAGPPSDHDRLKQVLAAEAREGSGEIWLMLVGHGTFDGKEAKFNLRGPDVSATEVAEWLKPLQRPLAIVDTSSASAPFLAKLAGPKRVVVTCAIVSAITGDSSTSGKNCSSHSRAIDTRAIIAATAPPPAPPAERRPEPCSGYSPSSTAPGIAVPGLRRRG